MFDCIHVIFFLTHDKAGVVVCFHIIRIEFKGLFVKVECSSRGPHFLIGIAEFEYCIWIVRTQGFILIKIFQRFGKVFTLQVDLPEIVICAVKFGILLDCLFVILDRISRIAHLVVGETAREKCAGELRLKFQSLIEFLDRVRVSVLQIVQKSEPVMGVCILGICERRILE